MIMNIINNKWVPAGERSAAPDRLPNSLAFHEGEPARPGLMGLWRADPECAQFPLNSDIKSQ